MFSSVRLQQFCVCWEPLEESYACLSVNLLPPQLPSVHPDAWGGGSIPLFLPRWPLVTQQSCLLHLSGVFALLISALTAFCSLGRDGG